MKHRNNITRRDLLRSGSRAALLGGAAAAFPAARLLGAAGMAPPGDYRALVCVFLDGGADGFNLVVPRSAPEYAVYAESRQGLALPLDDLIPIHPLTSDGAQYGLAPQVPQLAQRFEEGRLAIVANVGPLVEPISVQQYHGGSAPLPAHLFSHSSQHERWDVAQAGAQVQSGWCGRLADALAWKNGASPLPLSISMTGDSKMLVGASTAPYFLSPWGTEPLDGMGETRLKAAFHKLVDGDHPHLLERRYALVQAETVALEAILSAAFETAPSFEGLFDPESPLARQLESVARTIALRETLGMSRQVFYVDQLGYDTHEDQHQFLPPLLTELSQALHAFQTALEEIGAESEVVTFSASEFGRTLTTNGKGSDHGWGNHHLVMGGPVVGREIHGAMPDLALGGPDDVESGRILPRQSVDQYAATLAKWFGLPAQELDAVFPNLSHFDAPDLGFVA